MEISMSSSLTLLPLSSSSAKPPTPPPSSLSLSSFTSINNSSSFLFSLNTKTLRCSRGTSRSGAIRTQRPRRGLTCNALFGLGVPELVVIAGVAALVFGPKKLPEVGRSIGKTVKSFQQAAKEFESELKKEPDPTSDLTEQPKAVSQEKEDDKAPVSKESV